VLLLLLLTRIIADLAVHRDSAGRRSLRRSWSLILVPMESQYATSYF